MWVEDKLVRIWIYIFIIGERKIIVFEVNGKGVIIGSNSCLWVLV